MKTSTKIILAVVFVIILISVGYYFYNKNRKKKITESPKINEPLIVGSEPKKPELSGEFSRPKEPKSIATGRSKSENNMSRG